MHCYFFVRNHQLTRQKARIREIRVLLLPDFNHQIDVINNRLGGNEIAVNFLEVFLCERIILKARLHGCNIFEACTLLFVALGKSEPSIDSQVCLVVIQRHNFLMSHGHIQITGVALGHHSCIRELQ